MKITLNNRPDEVNKDTISMQELIEYKNFTFKMLVTKINGKLVKKDERKTAFIKNDDNVQIIHLISGG